MILRISSLVSFLMVLMIAVPALTQTTKPVAIQDDMKEFKDGLITWNDVYESEPNDECDQANWIDIGDRVRCGTLNLDPPGDLVDFFRFELSTSRTISIWLFYTFDECVLPLECMFFRLYDEDCSSQIGNGGGCVEPNQTEFRTDFDLQPGIYNIMVYTPDIIEGGYHLALYSVWDVPTLSEWGMLLLGLLILALGTIVSIRTRKKAVA